MEFYVQTNKKDTERNLKLQFPPSDLKDKVKEVIIEYWDMFCEDGFRRTIWGFLFQIDTCNYPPIFCKSPRYGPHESEVMQKMAERMYKNGVV